ncbi:MAG: DUF4249 domain-containing protein [Bacteroidales bacterium]|nr:DUF4249 domain-containing protein [Bacteroidales bacterium]
MRNLLLTIASILCIAGCSKEFDNSGVQLVIDGYIDDGGYPVIYVTTTLPITEDITRLEDLDEHLAIFGKATITVDGKTTTLFATPRSTVMPPYVYTTYELKGEAGKTYTLDVTYYDLHATATTTIPEKVALDDIWYEQVNDSLYTIKAKFTDNEEDGDHYKFFSYSEQEDYSNYGSCMMGLLDDGSFASRSVQTDVFKPISMDAQGYSPYFRKGETVHVKFSTLDDDSYEFWTGYEGERMASRIALFPSTNNLKSNINGGLGLWAGYGSTFYTVQIPE